MLPPPCRFLAGLAVAALLPLLAGAATQTSAIDLASVLREMIDREAIARFPAPAYTCRQFSSYNRASVRPGHYTWFANFDTSFFVRAEHRAGRRELVVFDAEGPGAIVRFWATYADYQNNGTLRFYFDGEASPRLQGETKHLLSGGGLTGYPLSFSVSEQTPYDRRGHNLYLPISYGRHLKITYESPTIEPALPDPIKGKEKFYYQINYRTYAPDTSVTSFTRQALQDNAALLAEVQTALRQRDRGLSGVALAPTSLVGRLAPGASVAAEVSGSRAIRRLSLALKAADLPQALRSTVLEIAFDGDRTVWAPVGDFFGTGYKISPASTWYTEVTADGRLTAWWVMPFRRNCAIKLTNHGTQEVEILAGEAATAPWRWTSDSLHFGCSWHQYTRIDTGAERARDGQGDMRDLNFTTLAGEGVYVGDSLALFNPITAWWGEGDEKIFVDHEPFPSHFGTGTEDYYGYAWCRPEPFVHPLIAQPDGSGNLGVGFTVDARYRLLDRIPFRRHLRFDMELWHWGRTTMNYAPVTFWYLKPGGRCEIAPDLAGARAQVALSRAYFCPPVPDVAGRIQGEDLILRRVSGGVARMNVLPTKPLWKEVQLLWQGGQPGDELLGEFEIQSAGTYELSADLLRGPEAAHVSIAVNGKPLRRLAQTAAQPGRTVVPLGSAALKAGPNTLTVTLLPSGPAVRAHRFGLDYLALQKAN